MNILVDRHHQGLTESFHLLFGKRLGHNLFGPIGIDWFDKGYFKIAEPYGNNPATIGQFLLVGQPMAPFPDLNNPPQYFDGEPQDLLTFDEFCSLPIDIVIASIPAHIEPFKELIARYKPNAKLIFQIGNAWEIPNNSVRNVMASAICYPPIQVNYIQYHQEFDTDMFSYTPGHSLNMITSFVHTLGGADLFKEDWEYFQALERCMPEFRFFSHGALCRDGVINTQAEIAKKMKFSKFGFHLKKGGDGYGHTIHQWFACGKPPIVRLEQYKGKLASQLMIDGETCIAVDGLSPAEAANKIKSFYDTRKYKLLCKQAAKRFKKVVNFDKEEQSIREFLKVLL